MFSVLFSVFVVFFDGFVWFLFLFRWLCGFCFLFSLFVVIFCFFCFLCVERCLVFRLGYVFPGFGIALILKGVRVAELCFFVLLMLVLYCVLFFALVGVFVLLESLDFLCLGGKCLLGVEFWFV